MNRLRILGSVELTRADGGELRALLAQPKRLALLVYLALAAPGGYCRRDTLLALFWPDLDDSHARDALKQAVRFLRQGFGGGPPVIVGRGTDELGVDRQTLWCDAVSFQQALADGRYEEALELYRGDLLEGFFSDTSGAFNDWLDRDRARLRAGAADAARAAAEEQERRGNYTTAVARARRVLELAEADERALRQLLNLLDRLGDRAGAVQAYETFALRLAREYEVEPAAETRALIERIRARTDARDLSPGATPPSEPSTPAPRGTGAPVAEPTPPKPVAPVGSTQVANGDRPTPLPRAQPRLDRVRRHILIGSSLLAALVAGVVVPRIARRPRVPPTPVEARPVAVMPFVVRGDPDLAYLSEGMVDLLSVSLDGATDLRSVNPRTLLSAVARAGGASSVQDPSRARLVARELGARAYVLGTVVSLGPRIRIAAWLYPVGPADGDTAQASVEGEARHASLLVDRLTMQLLIGLSRGEGAHFARLGAVTTHSLPALKAYLEGEARWRVRQGDSAVAAFRRAVDHDSTFALAHYRLAVAAEWSTATDPDDAVEQVARYRTRLPERHRDLLRAFEARRQGAVYAAESLYLKVLRSYPDDAEAWFQLGTLRTPHVSPWGRPIQDAREAFERVLALDPGHPRAPGALSWLDGHEGRHADAVRRLRRLLATDRGDLGLVIRSALAFAQDDDAAHSEAIARLRQVTDVRPILFAADFVAQRVGHLEGGIRAAAVLTEPSRPPRWRAFGYVRVADIELLRGRPGAAWGALSEAERLSRPYGLLARTYAALNPVVPVPETELAALHSALAKWLPGSMRDSIRREYLVGRVSARRGDYLGALASAEQLESRAGMLEQGDSAQASAMATDLALAVRADVAWRRGRHAEALSLLERWRPERWWVAKPTVTKPDPDELTSLSTGTSYAFERWVRAELLASTGRAREAIDWYAALGFLTGEDMMYLAPSRLRMAELYERLGERRQAIEQYERFVRLWRNCDPQFRPVVADVSRRILRLRSNTERRR